MPELRWHLERFAEPGERGLVFVGPKGAPLRRSNFRPIWNAARTNAGAPEMHFHDLRHVGGTLADLPARHQGPGPGDRYGHGRGVHHGQAEKHNQGSIGHATGTEAGEGVLMAMGGWSRTRVDLGFWVGAGEGNRTLMTSLEGR